MEHIAAFMLLVGCNGTATDCTEIPVPVPAYEDAVECGQELRLQVRLSESRGGNVYGVCRAVDEETFEQSSSVDWSIDKTGHLIVRFDAEPQILASR